MKSFSGVKPCCCRRNAIAVESLPRGFTLHLNAVNQPRIYNLIMGKFFGQKRRAREMSLARQVPRCLSLSRPSRQLGRQAFCCDRRPWPRRATRPHWPEDQTESQFPPPALPHHRRESSFP